MLIAIVALIAVVLAVISRLAARWWFERANRVRHRREANGIVTGADAVDLPSDSERGVLLLHGFGDTPQTLREMAISLHAQGYGVIVPLLPGHGRALPEFVRTVSSQWLAAAEDALGALRSRHSQLGVVGLSMGGALAVTLAARHPELRAMVLIAPYLGVPSAARRLTRWRSIVRHVLPYFPAMGAGSIHDPRARTESLAYGALNVDVLAELVRTVDTAYELLPSLQVPLLMIQSRQDNRIPVEVAERAFARIGSRRKDIVWLSGSGHILTVDLERERVTSETVGFLERTMQSASSGVTG